jgi:hypothetical protein
MVQRRDAPDHTWYIGKGKVEELKQICLARRRRHGGVRQRARAGPAVQPGEGARPHGDRPHRGDPRHLRPERPHPRGQGAGRAGAAALPAAPVAARQERQPVPAARRRRGPLRWRRDQARGRPAAHHAPDHQARGRPPPARRHPRAAAQEPRAQRPRQRGDRRLHQRRQVVAAQPAHRRRRARPRTGCSPRSTHHAPPVAARRRAGAAHRHRRLRPQAAARAGRGVQGHARGGGDADYSCTWSTPASPTPRGRSRPCATVLDEIDAAAVPELLVFNKADLAPDDAKRLVRAPSRSVAVSAVTGEGIDDFLRVLGDRLRALTAIVELLDPVRPRRHPGAAMHREGEVVSTSETEDAGSWCGRGSPMRASGTAGRLRRRRGDLRRLGPHGRCRAGFVPPPYPYDGSTASSRWPSVRGWADRPVDRHAVRPAAAAVVEALSSSNAERGYPPSIGTPRCAPPRRLDRPPVRRRRPPRRSPRASAPRSSSPRCRSGCACARPDATPCCTRRSRTPPTRWAPSSPGAERCRCRSDRRRPRPRPRSTRPTPRGRCAVGEQPEQPDGRARRPRRRRGLGAGPRRARVLRRVLRRVHLGRPPRTILEHGSDGVVAVHSLSKRSNLAGTRSASTPATPSSSTTCARCASTSA